MLRAIRNGSITVVPLLKETVPRRAMVRVMPKAMASSLPVNQRATMALCATYMDSQPMPKRTSGCRKKSTNDARPSMNSYGGRNKTNQSDQQKQ